MKKKLLALLLTVLAMCCSLFLVGCGDNQNNNTNTNQENTQAGGDTSQTGGDQTGSGSGEGTGGNSGEQTQPPAVQYESTAGLEYTLSADGTYYICTGIGTVTGEDIIIGSTYEGKPVKEIKETAFAYNNNIKNVTIPESIEIIGKDAFLGCNLINYNYKNGGLYLGNNENKYYALIGLADTTLKSFAMEDAAKIIATGSLTSKTELQILALSKNLKNDKGLSVAGCISLNELSRPVYADGVAMKNVFTGITNIPKVIFYGQEVDSCATFSNNELTSVYIGDSFSSIGSSAFYGCTSLTSVTIPDSVTSIGYNAFYDCTSLTSVMIPEKVTSIGYNAFYGCTSLTSVTIPDSVMSIGSSAFYLCDSLTSVTIGENVESIGSSAFSDCNSLTSITIPDKVTSIGSNAFRACNSLTSITIGESVTSIGSLAFLGCSKLTRVDYNGDINSWVMIKFGNGYVESYYANPLYYVKHLYINGEEVTEVVLDTATKVSAYAFYNATSITKVTIGNQVQTIGDNAFSGCDSLTSVTIGENVQSIGSMAFSGCSNLQSMTLPFVGSSKTATEASATTLFGYIFGAISYTGGTATEQYYSRGKCKTYYIPSTLKNVTITGGNILYGAFYNCDSLTSITIGEEVETIGDNAFSGCDSLTYTEYENGLYIGNASNPYLVLVKAKDKSITSCTINSNCKCICSDAFFYAPSLTSITVDESNTAYKSIDGNLYTKDGTTLIQYAKGKTATSFVIPNSVTTIGSYAFIGGDSLTSVTIGENVESIGSYAFYWCDSLTSITIPDKVTSIGYGAFRDCTALTEIKFNATAMNALENDNDVFYDAGHSGTGIKVTIGKNVTKIPAYLFFYTNYITSVEFEEGSVCTTIGYRAFYCCGSLTSVTMPNSVTSISNDAFYGCSKLTRVDYNGDINSWAMIEFGNYNANPLYYAKHLYINGEEVTEVVLDTATKVNAYAFYNATSITKVTIGNQVQSIGSSAFYNCSSLTSVKIGANVTSIGSSAFYGCNKLLEVINKSSLNITKGSTSNGYVGYYAKQVLTEEPATSNFITSGDYKFYNDNGSYYLLVYTGTATEITLPENINGNNYAIYQYAFYYNNKITSVVISSGVTSIGYMAFYNCTALISVTIGENVQSIGYMAFYNCSSLTSITFEDTSTWYYTSTSNHNYTGGTKTGVTNTSTNATNLKSRYDDYYWYKV